MVDFSIAGPPTELLGDIAYRIPPLTDIDVKDLLTDIKSAPPPCGGVTAAPFR